MPDERETPPRTWGRLLFDCPYRTHTRNTPTHVGKTLPTRPCQWCGKKHPHARGEDHTPPTISAGFSETPPRTWGRLHPEQPGTLAHRNTPTHVGKTLGKKAWTSSGRKHPHARGEDNRPVSAVTLNVETPPRTWGRQSQKKSKKVTKGNTPTHVGKTISLSVLCY